MEQTAASVWLPQHASNMAALNGMQGGPVIVTTAAPNEPASSPRTPHASHGEAATMSNALATTARFMASEQLLGNQPKPTLPCQGSTSRLNPTTNSQRSDWQPPPAQRHRLCAGQMAESQPVDGTQQEYWQRPAGRLADSQSGVAARAECQAHLRRRHAGGGARV